MNARIAPTDLYFAAFAGGALCAGAVLALLLPTPRRPAR